MIPIGENERALANPNRVALAEIESRPGRLRFGVAIGATYGAGPDPQTGDIGRAVAAYAGGALRTLRLWHMGAGIGWRAWSGDPHTATPTEGVLALPTFAGQSLGAWMEPDGTAFVTHCPAIDLLEIRRRAPDGVWTLHQAGAALPAAVNTGAGGYTAFSIVDRRALFLLHVRGDGRQARLWEGTFASPTHPFTGALAWNELPYRVTAGHAEDRFKATPGAGEVLDRRTANGFDAARFGGNTIVLCQDHAAGRSQVLVRSEGKVWSDPAPVVPMDMVDEANFLLLSRLFVHGETLLATGMLGRNGSRFPCLLRSGDGRTWSFGSDALLAPTLAGTHHGQLVAEPSGTRLHFLAGSWSRSLATPPTAGVVVAPYYAAIERGARSVPTAEIEIPADGDGPGEDDALTIRLGYDARANLVEVGTFRLDRVSETRTWQGTRRALHLREQHGKTLHDWASPYTYDLWGQSRHIAELEDEGEIVVSAGEPRPSMKRVRLAQPFDVSHATIVLQGADGKPPVSNGERLRHRDGQLATRVRIAGPAAGDGPYSYSVVVEQAEITSFPAGSELACDELFLGRLGAEDAAFLDLPRRFQGQFGTCTLRFSEHDHRYGEAATVLLHRADDANGYRVRVAKVDGGAGTTGLQWTFERVAEGTATNIATGLLMDGAQPLTGIHRTLYLRWRIQNGRVVLWAAPSTLFGAPLVEYVEETVLPPGEGGLGFGGRTDPITHPTTAERGEQSGATAPDGCLLLDAPATALPAQGALRVSGATVPYSARSLQARLPSGPISPQYDITLANFEMVQRFDGGWWLFHDTLPYDVTGMVACVRARKEMLTPTVPAGVGDEYTRVTACELAYDDGGTPRTRLQLTLAPDKNRTQTWWNYGPPAPFESIGWLVGMRFYPCFTLETDDWPSIGAAETVKLDVRPEQAPLGTALDRAEVCDLELDLSLAEGVQTLARLAGVEVAADKLPEAAWGLASGGGWTVSFVGGMPRLQATAGGTRWSTVTLTDGVLRARLRLGEAGLAFDWPGGGTTVRFASGNVEFRDVLDDTLRASVPYAQGAAGALASVRLSIEGACLSVWLDDAFAAFYVDERLRGQSKRLGIVAFAPTTIEWIEVLEAYEKWGRFLLSQGATAAESIAQTIGERRLGLLFRANRPPRFGTLEQREAVGPLLGTILVTGEEQDDAAARTLAQVRGADAVASASLGLERYGLRFVAVENPDLLTADGCAREARNLLRHTQEQAHTATIELRADLRVENEDHCRATIGAAEADWIVDSSALTFLVAPDDAALDMRLGLRRVV